MTDEQKTPKPPEGFEIVTEEYRRANEYPSVGAVEYLEKTHVEYGWRPSVDMCGWDGFLAERYTFAIEAEQTPDIPTQVGAIAERCARISETTAHRAFFALYTHVEFGYVSLQVYIAGWQDPVSEEKYKRADFRKDANLAADANRWLDKVMTEAGAVE